MGDASAWDNAVRLAEEQLQLTPTGHPARAEGLDRLGNRLLDRYRSTYNESDINETIKRFTEVVDLTPSSHSERPVRDGNLAGSLLDRYRLTSVGADLDNAMHFAQEAVDLLPPSHPSRAMCIDCLALSFWNRYHKVGAAADLDRAIQLETEIVGLTFNTSSDRAILIGHLVSMLTDRYILTNVEADLEKATRLQQDVVELTPTTDPDRSVAIGSLAVLFLHQSKRTRSVSDLDKSIELGQEAVEGTPSSHPGRALWVANLATALLLRHRLANRAPDLDEAIRLQREAVELTASQHPNFVANIANLANSLSDRYCETGSDDDLKVALHAGEQAVTASETIPGPNRTFCLITFCKLLRAAESQVSILPIQLFGLTLGTPADIHKKHAELLREAALHSTSFVHHRFVAACLWHVHSDEISSALEAAQCALDLLDGVVEQGRSLEGQYIQLSSELPSGTIQAFVSDATSLALDIDDVPLAVSLLEHGRSIIFSQLGRFRTSLDDVKALAPDLASEFLDLSLELQRLLAAPEGNAARKIATTPEDHGARYNSAQNAWNNVVELIRKRKGLEGFLRRPAFAELQQVACEGPVVMVNTSEGRSDAIIIFHRKDPVLVALPEASPRYLQALCSRLGPRPASLHDNDLCPILRGIWDVICDPVAQSLHQQGYPKGRLWWCPTGPASRLPLHAAGPYQAGKRNMSQMYVQSYTPTLGALVRARKLRAAEPSTRTTAPEILLVGQPNAPYEEVALPKVAEEIRAIEECAPHAKTLSSEKASRAGVLDGLGQYSWVHLACHGHHHATQPFLSNFSMWDGPITLLDLVQKDLPNAELAVLSACHSAKLSEELPDEVLHPAAGMLFAGFRGVIGTMWALEDGLGSELSAEFYKEMLCGSEGPKDYRHAASGLAKALKALRRRGFQMPLAQWTNVIHVGA